MSKSLFQPSHKMLVRDQFLNVMSWTFQSCWWMEQCRLIVLVAGYGEAARDICCRNSRSVVRVHLVYFSSGTGFQKRYYLVAKMPKHPTSHRNGYVVVLPIQMYKSQTLNLPPRVLCMNDIQLMEQERSETSEQARCVSPSSVTNTFIRLGESTPLS